MRNRLLLSALAIACLAAGATADEAIKLKNGKRLTGDATAYNAETKVLSFRTDDGVDHQLSLDELDGRSVYHVTRSKVPQDSANGQLQLANYARDIELYAHAVRHYGYAEKADPSLKGEVAKQMAILKTAAGAWAMNKAREAADKGNIKDAEKWLKKILDKLPDEPVAAEAATLLDNYYTKVRAEKAAEQEQKQDDELKKSIVPAKKFYESMLEKNKKALTARNSSTSLREWKGAVKDGERTLKELDKISKGLDAEKLEVLEGYRIMVENQVIDIHLNVASHYATQTSYQKAQKEVNKALAVDPRSKAALDARARIEAASNRGWW